MINTKQYRLDKDLLIGKAKKLFSKRAQGVYYGDNITVTFNTFKTRKFRKIQCSFISFNKELLSYLEKTGDRKTGTVKSYLDYAKVLETNKIIDNPNQHKHVEITYLFYVPVNFDFELLSTCENSYHALPIEAMQIVNVLSNLNY